MKKPYVSFLAFVGLITLLVAFFINGYINNRLKQENLNLLTNGINIGENSDKVNYHIDEEKIENNKVYIKGWSIVKGINSLSVTQSILLKDESENIYRLNAVVEKRPEITVQFNDGNNYNNSGFVSVIDAKQLKNHEKYKIGIQTQINNQIFYTWTSSEIMIN